MDAEAPERKPSPARFVVWVAAAIALFVLLRALDLEHTLRAALAWIDSLGPLAPAAFIALYVVATILFLPGSILTLGAGAVFGLIEGTVYVSIAATLGATAAFLIARYVARDWVEARIARNPKFRAVDEAVAREGWKIVGLIRLSPVFPFNVLNYAFGVTRVSLKDYFFASWVGMIPGTLLYVYVGSLAGDLATLGAEGRTRTPLEWSLYGVGLLATVVVTLYVTRLARKTLEERIAT